MLLPSELHLVRGLMITLLKSNMDKSLVTKNRGGGWKCIEQIPTPQTKDGCAPALTSTYEYASLVNMFDTGHYPRMGVIEIGDYE